MTTAKLFWNGRSQAVRLPKEFRFDATEVTITRQGSRIVLEPVRAEQDLSWLEKVTGPLDQDFIDAALSEPQAQFRPDLEKL